THTENVCLWSDPQTDGHLIEPQPLLTGLLNHHPFACGPMRFRFAMLNLRREHELHSAVALWIRLQRKDAAGVAEIMAVHGSLLAQKHRQRGMDLRRLDDR